MQNEKEQKKEYVAPEMSIVDFKNEVNLLVVQSWKGEGG